MLPKELIKKIRRIEIRAYRFHSDGVRQDRSAVR
jgi:hypothetical protein